jgi:hypothetical protein
MSNLLVALLDKMDVPTERFGDSTGLLTIYETTWHETAVDARRRSVARRHRQVDFNLDCERPSWKTAVVA